MKKQQLKNLTIQKTYSNSKFIKRGLADILPDQFHINITQNKIISNNSAKKSKRVINTAVQKGANIITKIINNKKLNVFEKFDIIINSIKEQKKVNSVEKLELKICNILNQYSKLFIQKLKYNLKRKNLAIKSVKLFFTFSNKKLSQNLLIAFKNIIYCCNKSNQNTLTRININSTKLIFKILQNTFKSKKKNYFQKMKQLLLNKKIQNSATTKLMRYIKKIQSNHFRFMIEKLKLKLNSNNNNNSNNMEFLSVDKNMSSRSRNNSTSRNQDIKSNQQMVSLKGDLSRKNDELLRLQNQLSNLKNQMNSKLKVIKQLEKKEFTSKIINQKLTKQNQQLISKNKQLQASLFEHSNQMNINIIASSQKSQSDKSQQRISDFDRSFSKSSKSLDKSRHSQNSNYSNFSLNTVNFLRSLQEKGHKNCKYKSKFIEQLKLQNQLKQKLELMEAEYQLMAQINKHFENSISDHVNKNSKAEESLIQNLKNQYQIIKEENQDLKLKANSYKSKIIKLQQDRQKTKKDFKKKLQDIYSQLKKKNQITQF